MFDRFSFVKYSEKKIIYYSVVSFIAVFVGFLIDYKFFPGESAASRFIPNRFCDGFQDQLRDTLNFITNSSFSNVLNDALSWVHILRLVIVGPFILADEFLGPIGVMILLVVLITPLIFAFSTHASDGVHDLLWYARPIVLAGVLFLSGRSMLVAIGMGYLTLAILGSSRPFPKIFFGSITSVLSSGAVLITLGVHFWQFCMKRKKFLANGMIYATVLLGIIILPSIVVKLQGFSGNADGYSNAEVVAPVRSSCGTIYKEAIGLGSDPKGVDMANETLVKEKQGNVLVRVLSRSTIAASYVNGQKFRLIIYLILLGAVVVAIIDDLRRRSLHPVTPIILMCSFGFLVEGVGIWAILFPLMWRMTWPHNGQHDLTSKL